MDKLNKLSHIVCFGEVLSDMDTIIHIHQTYVQIHGYGSFDYIQIQNKFGFSNVHLHT